MQLALSMLNGVYITGQPTTLPLHQLRSIYEQMAAAGAAGMESNMGKGYDHHIGLNNAECLDAVRGFAESVWLRGLVGDWIGAKLNGICVDDDLLNRLWPKAYFIVCVRDPWATWVSLRNSFAPLLDWVKFYETWTEHVGAALGNTQAIMIKLEDSPTVTAATISAAFNVGPIEVFRKALTHHVHAASTNRPRVEYNPQIYSCSERFALLADRLGYKVNNDIVKEGT